MDRLAQRGTTFENAYNGSTPCMPARRDIYTGRYEFLERAWGPLEEDDDDLPRRVSGPPNSSIPEMKKEGYRVSELITDHYHLWEEGSGNYHMGYTGFEFIRGQESDNWKTAPAEFEKPNTTLPRLERHYRNTHGRRDGEADHYAPRVFSEAADWLYENHTHDDFYLHLDCFDPHQPWDPPEELLERFDSRGYDVGYRDTGTWDSVPIAGEWREHYTEGELRHIQARYAAMVVLVDRWLGELLDAMDELGLWEDTMVILTTDHGIYNGDHGKTGKFPTVDTHSHDACSHIPFIVAHPEHGHGERRDQLVQLVDIYPTVLDCVDRPIPSDIHGVNLTEVLADRNADTRDYALSGVFGQSVTITDGEWVLHQRPEEGNEPLYWYGHYGETKDYLGPCMDGKREASVDYRLGVPSWLSDKRTDPSEFENVIDSNPEKAAELRGALRDTLDSLDAPPEHLERLGIDGE